MKTNAFVPMSPVAPTAKMVVEEDSPKSPSYSPDGPFANTTPLVDDDSMECTTPPPEDDFEPETPPMSEEEDEDAEEGSSEKTPSVSSASSSKSTSSPVHQIVPEWDVSLASPVVTGIEWIVSMESPVYKKK